MFIYVNQVLPDNTTKLISINSDQIERISWEPHPTDPNGDTTTYIHFASGNRVVVEGEPSYINNKLGTVHST